MILDGLIILFENWDIVLPIVILQSTFALGTGWFLSELNLDTEPLAVFSFIGGILGLTLFCLLVVMLQVELSTQLGLISAFIAVFILLLARNHILSVFSIKLLLLQVFFVFILLIRLFFVKDLIVPPYSDSIQHFLIVQDFLNPNSASQSFFKISADLSHYYHFGFHAIATWISGTTETSVPQAIMVIGQYFQSLAILGAYILSYALTKNKDSAWIAMFISGLYLSLPAYASNWGKYPAIASLSGMCFILSVFLLSIKSKKFLSLKLCLIIFLSMLITGLLHSRSLIVSIFSFILILLYIKFKVVLKDIAVFLIITTLIVFFVLSNLSDWHVSTLFQIVFVIAIIFSLYAKFEYTIALMLFLLVVNLSTFFSLHFAFLPIRFEKILDRQFVLIIIYVPVALVFQNAIEGGINLFSKGKKEFWRRIALLGILLIGIVNTLFFQNHSPSSCCNFINDDDLFSFEWMRQNIPKDSIVGIASTGYSGNLAASDGGGWIEIMTNIPTRKINIMTDFIQAQNELCKDKIEYLYVETLENSFDEYNIIESGGKHVFNLGSINIYKLDCDNLGITQ